MRRGHRDPVFSTYKIRGEPSQVERRFRHFIRGKIYWIKVEEDELWEHESYSVEPFYPFIWQAGQKDPVSLTLYKLVKIREGERKKSRSLVP